MKQNMIYFIALDSSREHVIFPAWQLCFMRQNDEPVADVPYCFFKGQLPNRTQFEGLFTPVLRGARTFRWEQSYYMNASGINAEHIGPFTPAPLPLECQAVALQGKQAFRWD